MNTKRVLDKWIEDNRKFAAAKRNHLFSHEPRLKDYPELLRTSYIRDLAEAWGRKARGEEI